MYTKLIYTSKSGLTLDLFNDEFFDLVDAENLTFANTSIAAATIPTIDGDNVNNIQANPRPIALYLRVKNYVDVELCKRHILNVIKLKQKAKLTFTQGLGDEQRIIEIDGLVESVEMPRFSNSCTMIIHLHCENSYWQDVNAVIVEISRVIGSHHFEIFFPINAPIPLGYIDRQMTQSYTNDGDVDTGVIISIVALGAVTNPRITNAAGEYIGVNDSLVANDKIIINTNKGSKTITKNGVSILNKIKAGSTFIQMATGENQFTIGADSGAGNMYFNITFKRQFI